MNMYYYKLYFKGICSANFAAYERMRKLRVEKDELFLKKMNKEIEDIDEYNAMYDEIENEFVIWDHMIHETQKIVGRIIDEVKELNEKLNITCKEEVYALILEFTQHYKKFNFEDILILNEGYPEDEISLKFKKAYLEKDRATLLELATHLYSYELYTSYEDKYIEILLRA